MTQLAHLQSFAIPPVFAIFFVFAYAFGLLPLTANSFSIKILHFIYFSGFLSGLVYSLHLESYFITSLFFLNYLIYLNLNRPIFKNYLFIYLLSSFIFFLLIISLKNPGLYIYFNEIFIIFLLLFNMFFLILRYDIEHNHIIKHQQGKSSRRVGVNKLLNSKNILDKKLLLFVLFISTILVIIGSTATYLFSDKYFSFNQNKSKSNLKLPSILNLNQKGKISLSDKPVISMTASETMEKRRLYLRGKTLSHYFKGIWRSSSKKISRKTKIPSKNLEKYKITQYIKVNHGYSLLNTYRISSSIPGLEYVLLDDSTIHYNKLPEEELKYTIFVDNDNNYHKDQMDRKFLEIPLEIKLFLKKSLPQNLLKLGNSNKTDLIIKKTQDFLNNYQYGDTYFKPNGNQDPNIYFLNRIKKGPCGLFASSAALILRYLGIPSRLVMGFSKAGKTEKTLIFRGKNAHSWVEYHHPATGWQIFDPTVGSRPEPNTVIRQSEEEKINLIKILFILIPISLVLICFIIDEVRQDKEKKQKQDRKLVNRNKKKKISITAVEASAIFNQLINCDYFKDNPRNLAESAQNYGLRLVRGNHPGGEKVVLASKLANEILFSSKPKYKRKKLLNKLKDIQKEVIEMK
ncbi:MAG: transglutaminase-like domain-containing protein [Myxococcota bacterium]